MIAAERLTLTERERAILALIWHEYTDKEIARHLGISEETVADHLRLIYTKLGARNRTGACRLALFDGYDLHPKAINPARHTNV